MARKSPLDKLKDAAVGTVKDPLGVAGKALGHARGTVAVGRTLAAHTVSAVIARMPGHGSTAPAPPVPPAPARTPAQTPAQPAAAPSPSVPEPEAVVTEIDRAAEHVEVDATPADLAKLVAKKAPAARKPAKTAASAKKAAARPAPTKSNTPGAKLPPRKVVPDAEAEQADGPS